MECAIFDLDGTLLDTEQIVDEVLEEIVVGYGKQWSSKNLEKRLGKRPIEAAIAVVEDYELPCTPEKLLEQLQAKVFSRWPNSKALPGATRLLEHLYKHKVPMVLASNSPRRNVTAKLQSKPAWNEFFSFIIAGDEVTEAKPAPEIYLKAAKLLNADTSSCIVFEDSPTGILAGKAAGMTVVAIPSLRSKSARPQYAPADCVLSSLLDFKPEIWALPPFQDWVGGALPLEPWYICGSVVKGFGRGSKLLGIPTANLSTDSFSKELAQQTCGVYFGWASLMNKGPFKMVMSVGWNPYFDNTEKTMEAWLLHEFEQDFYGEELRLLIVGYIRPESDFKSLDDLIRRIKLDGSTAESALELAPFCSYREDKFLNF